MKWHLLTLVTLILGGAWLFACPSNFNVNDCVGACTRLASCGFLPSSLGTSLTDVTGTDNCINRCEESNDTVVKAIHDCAIRVDTGDDATAPQCSQGCASVAKCLISEYPKDDVLGLAGVIIVPVLADPRRAGEAGPDGEAGPEGEAGPDETSSALRCQPPPCSPEAGACPTSTGIEFVGDRPLAWCRGESATEVRTFVFQGGAYSFSDTTGCADLLTRPPTFTSLDPGQALVGLEVRGRPTVEATDAGPSVAGDGGSGAGPDAAIADAGAPDAGGQPFCHQYYGDQIALLAGKVQTALVALRNDAAAPVLDCEEGDILCHDQKDNDQNGLVDCSDPRCAAVCLDAGASPNEASAASVDASATVDAMSDSGSE
jgi:hypothetical protein